MKLSIIIPAKNEERCIKRLLDSVKKQEFKSYEIIVADANSTDRTRQISRTYGCRIVQGGLPAVGRNNGAKAAGADMLLFLDADTFLPNNFLQLSLDEFEKRKLDCASVDFEPISVRISDKILFFISNFWNRLMQFLVPSAGGATILCKKSVFKKIKGFDEKLLLCEDQAFVKACANNGKFRILNSTKTFLDVRRLDEEGRVLLSLKYAYAAVSRVFLGERREAPISYSLHGGVKIKRGESLNGAI